MGTKRILVLTGNATNNPDIRILKPLKSERNDLQNEKR